jgi:hypothetical protein
MAISGLFIGWMLNIVGLSMIQWQLLAYDNPFGESKAQKDNVRTISHQMIPEWLHISYYLVTALFCLYCSIVDNPNRLDFRIPIIALLSITVIYLTNDIGYFFSVFKYSDMLRGAFCLSGSSLMMVSSLFLIVRMEASLG